MGGGVKHGGFIMCVGVCACIYTSFTGKHTRESIYLMYGTVAHQTLKLILKSHFFLSSKYGPQRELSVRTKEIGYFLMASV